MLLQTKIDIKKALFEINPTDTLLFVGSCFASEIGQRTKDDRLRATVNPYGVMYNPASVMHTVERATTDGTLPEGGVDTAVFTLGTNHVYILNETGEIVDNCMKRPQNLFTEKELSVDECATFLQQAIDMLRRYNKTTNVIITVSPIRYRKYGYHESQLSKATLLLAADRIVRRNEECHYFPAYEIMNDELRDYRFYKEDMLHPTPQAVAYIFDRFCDTYMSKEASTYMAEWKPIREALAHKPFNPDSPEYQQFRAQTLEKQKAFEKKYALR